jgi:hypothetical protein
MCRTVFIASLLLFAARGIAAAHPPDAATREFPSAHLAAVIADSAALSLPVRIERAFLLTLQAAAEALRNGETANAQILLRTFVVEVRGAARAKRVPGDAAGMLIARAEEVIGALGRPR